MMQQFASNTVQPVQLFPASSQQQSQQQVLPPFINTNLTDSTSNNNTNLDINNTLATLFTGK